LAKASEKIRTLTALICCAAYVLWFQELCVGNKYTFPPLFRGSSAHFFHFVIVWPTFCELGNLFFCCLL